MKGKVTGYITALIGLIAAGVLIYAVSGLETDESGFQQAQQGQAASQKARDAAGSAGGAGERVKPDDAEPLRKTATAERADEKPAIDGISDSLRQVFSETPMSIERLKSQYAGRLDDPTAQEALIEDYLYFLRKQYPDKADALFSELLHLAFSDDQAAMVLQKVQNLDAYREWYSANRDHLQDLPRQDRKDLLWNKRVEFFGDDAYAMWSGELKREEVARGLESIQSAEGAGLQEKYKMLDSAIKRAYGPDADAYTESHRQEIWDDFVSLESVQKDLADMAPEQRRKAMNNVRQRLGMPEDAIERLTELDRSRDQRWQNGKAYMKAREKIADEYSGEKREKMLNMLRREHFGQQAEVIANEENAGFFRFERERKYGLN